jgi:hypothetical protein
MSSYNLKEMQKISERESKKEAVKVEPKKEEIKPVKTPYGSGSNKSSMFQGVSAPVLPQQEKPTEKKSLLGGKK